jgi:hypothetical protein
LTVTSALADREKDHFTSSPTSPVPLLSTRVGRSVVRLAVVNGLMSRFRPGGGTSTPTSVAPRDIIATALGPRAGGIGTMKETSFLPRFERIASRP